VDRHLPKEALKRIQASRASLLGVVTNAVKPNSARADGYGYGYGKYGYGYGQPSYAYYHIDSELSDDSPETAPQKALPLWRERLQAANRSVIRWIDR
jgi:hypothetical protein